MNFLKKIVKNFLLKFNLNLNILREDIHRNDRHGTLHKSWGYIFSNHFRGDYVEFGVYKGDSFVSSILTYNKFYDWLKSQKNSDEEWRRTVAENSPLNIKPTFHCLDTFEGMPENNESFFQFQKGNFLGNLELVKKNINKANKHKLDIKYYKGLFSDTASQLNINLKGKRIAIVNIDCDLESSTIDALEAIKDYIYIGTVLMFDDYNCFNADMKKGQRKAFEDFKKNSSYIFEKLFSYHYLGQTFLIVDKK